MPNAINDLHVLVQCLTAMLDARSRIPPNHGPVPASYDEAIAKLSESVKAAVQTRT